ncbi:MAG: hypothetical protein P4L55_18135 [Syntrophobacteraceae bacterium]|nr:hypothetical protein [Syntrophobacteraceae bacterium]
MNLDPPASLGKNNSMRRGNWLDEPPNSGERKEISWLADCIHKMEAEDRLPHTDFSGILRILLVWYMEEIMREKFLVKMNTMMDGAGVFSCGQKNWTNPRKLTTYGRTPQNILQKYAQNGTLCCKLSRF